jgi:hypothetical protein
MTLHTFDKRLLEFMYQLTLHQKLMAPKEMAQVITIQGKKVSERTIKRWLKWLKAHHYFTYYLYTNYPKIGLVNANCILRGVKDDRIVKIIPFQDYLMKGIDMTRTKDCFFISYLMPQKNISDLKEFCKKAIKLNLIESYDIFETKQITTLYSEKHRIINEHGNVISHKLDLDTYFENLLQSKVCKNHSIGVDDYAKKNPIVVPLMLEYLKDHASFKTAWSKMKSKLGEGIWDYVGDLKTKLKKSDGAGIVYVQKTMRYLHTNLKDYFTQVRVSYGPLYSGENVNLYVFLKLKKKEQIIDLAREISKNSIYVLVNELNDRNMDVGIDFVTNNKFASEILSTIIPKYADTSKSNSIMWLSYHCSSPYWESTTKNWIRFNYHRLFDPKTVSWKYDSKKYLDELKQLSASGE